MRSKFDAAIYGQIAPELIDDAVWYHLKMLLERISFNIRDGEHSIGAIMPNVEIAQKLKTLLESEHPEKDGNFSVSIRGEHLSISW